MLARHLYLGPPCGKLHPGSPDLVVVVTRNPRGQNSGIKTVFIELSILFESPVPPDTIPTNCHACAKGAHRTWTAESK